MPIFFFDTSALVKRYVQEDGTDWVRTITESSSQNVIYIAEITGVEVMAAITNRMRKTLKEGGITESDGKTAIKEFRDDFENQYMIIEITGDVVSKAMNLTEHYPLRAYDAMQLAVALEIEPQIKAIATATTVTSAIPTLIFVSSDKDLNKAAIAEGLTLEDPQAQP